MPKKNLSLSITEQPEVRKREGVVYDRWGRGSPELTWLSLHLTGTSSANYAARIVAAVHLYMCVSYQKHGLETSPWAHDQEETLHLVDLMLTTYYDVTVGASIGTGKTRTVHFRAGCKPSTVKTKIDALSLGLELLHTSGIFGVGECMTYTYRGKQNPEGSKGSLDGGFQPSGDGPVKRSKYSTDAERCTVVPQIVLDGDALPLALRRGAGAAAFPYRTRSILETHITGGPRLTEVVEMTFAGLEDFNPSLPESVVWLHNKRAGRVPSKKVCLSREAVEALMAYFKYERCLHDPLREEFDEWARRRKLPYMPQHYLAFLKATRRRPSDFPVYLTRTRRALTSSTYRRTAWGRVIQAAGIEVRTHHIRHWFIIKSLDAIKREHGKDLVEYLTALLEFIHVMGWASYKSLRRYDHYGAAMVILDEHQKALEKASRKVIDHGSADKPLGEASRKRAQAAGLSDDEDEEDEAE